MSRLRLSEIFMSLQGETKTVGIPTAFIRLTGCPLRCQYCDTAYAFHGGTWYEMDTIMQRVAALQVNHVTVTGGEPLAQKPCLELLQRLCDEGYTVSLETSGAFDISLVDTRVSRVVDIKTPGSGEVDKNNYDNVNHFSAHDQIKFVICNKEDYDWSKKILSDYQLTNRCHVLFSPSYKELQATELANWIIEDKLPVRLQIQLHKYLWGDAPGR